MVQIIFENIGYYTPPPTVVLRPDSGHGHLLLEVSISHTNDTSQSVGLLWTSVQPDAETSTWQHTTFTTDIFAPGGIRTHNTWFQYHGGMGVFPRLSEVRPDYSSSVLCSWYGASWLLVILFGLVIWRVQITRDYVRARDTARPKN